METLKKSRQFKKVLQGGSREKLETIVVCRLPQQEGITRIGITVSRKAGRSVERNRIKRRVREALRRNASFLPESEDIVIIAGRKCLEADFKSIEEDIRKLGK